MQPAGNPSLRELKRETEQARTDLTETVDQLRTSVSNTAGELRQRISPESIKAEMTDYVRSKGERMFEDLTAAARRNPMQAIAVGASVAYPLLKLARAIPLPVIMLGAGIFFAGTNAGRSATQKVSDAASDLSDEVARRTHDLSDQVNASVRGVKDLASDAADYAGEMISTGADGLRRSTASAGSGPSLEPNSLRETTASIGKAVNAGVSDLKDGMAGLAHTATDAAQDLSAGITSAARNVATSTADAAREAAKGVRAKGSTLSDRIEKTFVETIEENPLLIAGMGLVLGGLIASALPRTDIEEDMVGDVSASAKRRAGEAASQGFDAAKDAAGQIVENVARQAGVEGLTPDHLDAAAKDIGERVKRVAESAVTTAFDPDSEPKLNTGGGNNHG